MKLFLYFRWQVASFYWARILFYFFIQRIKMLWVQLCNLLCCTSFRNILSGWISNFILPCLHLLYFLLDESSPTAQMSVLFFYLTYKVDVFCKYTVDYEALHMPSSSFLHRPRSILLSWLKLLTWKFKLLVVVSWLSRFRCRLVI